MNKGQQCRTSKKDSKLLCFLCIFFNNLSFRTEVTILSTNQRVELELAGSARNPFRRLNTAQCGSRPLLAVETQPVLHLWTDPHPPVEMRHKTDSSHNVHLSAVLAQMAPTNVIFVDTVS